MALYANVNGERFVRQDIAIPAIGDLNVINAALVDLNDDGWLDIVLTSYQEGNFVAYNRSGDFPADAVRRIFTRTPYLQVLLPLHLFEQQSLLTEQASPGFAPLP